MDITKLKEMLAADEGRKKKPYKCTAGHWTIGVGRNMDANPLPPEIATYLEETGEITDLMIDDLLDFDSASAILDCGKVWPGFKSFSENRQLALANFMFNVGIGTAKKFVNTNYAINHGNWERAAQGLENSLWYRQVPNRAKRIVALIRGG